MKDTKQMHERTRSIGSSDVAAILGLDQYRTSLDVWREKTIIPTATQDSGTPATRRGKFLEGPAIEWLEKAHPDIGRGIYPNAVYYELDQPTHAQCDAINADSVIEVKTVSRNAIRSGEWGEPWTDQVPARTVCQTLWQTGHAGKQGAWVLCAVLPGDPDEVLGLNAQEVMEACDKQIYRVEFDPETYKVMVGRCLAFWADHVEAMVPPAPTTMEAACSLWRYGVPGKEVVATQRDLGLIQALQKAKKGLRTITKLENDLKLDLATSMQDATIMTHPETGSPLIRWTTVKRAGYAVRPLTFRTMRIVAGDAEPK